MSLADKSLRCPPFGPSHKPGDVLKARKTHGFPIVLPESCLRKINAAQLKREGMLRTANNLSSDKTHRLRRATARLGA
eukprot:4346284-Alexandrium_andersonii.AAC.1